MTYHLNNLIGTDKIIENANYNSTPSEFFSKFAAPWDLVRGQILKLETRQSYKELANPSFEALQRGDLKKANELLEDSRKDDIILYSPLNKRQVDFIRCRPVVKPISTYLQWEIECYKWNEKQGERIYFLNRTYIFDNLALHDFMVFDHFAAFVHDYDDSGEIKGGWAITEESDIYALIQLFSIIKASSVYYTQFEL
jgi:hypothetical protein